MPSLSKSLFFSFHIKLKHVVTIFQDRLYFALAKISPIVDLQSARLLRFEAIFSQHPETRPVHITDV